MGMTFPCRRVRMLWNKQRWRLPYIVNVLNATELFTFKWLILSHVNLTSIKK